LDKEPVSGFAGFKYKDKIKEYPGYWYRKNRFREVIYITDDPYFRGFWKSESGGIISLSNKMLFKEHYECSASLRMRSLSDIIIFDYLSQYCISSTLFRFSRIP